MGRGRVAGRVSVVKQVGADRKRRRRQLDEARRIEAVIGRFVPLVAKIVLGQGCCLAGLKIGNAGIAPEAQVGVIISDGDRAEIAADIIDLEQLPGQ